MPAAAQVEAARSTGPAGFAARAGAGLAVMPTIRTPGGTGDDTPGPPPFQTNTGHPR